MMAKRPPPGVRPCDGQPAPAGPPLQHHHQISAARVTILEQTPGDPCAVSLEDVELAGGDVQRRGLTIGRFSREGLVCKCRWVQVARKRFIRGNGMHP